MGTLESSNLWAPDQERRRFFTSKRHGEVHWWIHALSYKEGLKISQIKKHNKYNNYAITPVCKGDTIGKLTLHPAHLSGLG
jgi:hypothetical protein